MRSAPQNSVISVISLQALDFGMSLFFWRDKLWPQSLAEIGLPHVAISSGSFLLVIAIKRPLLLLSNVMNKPSMRSWVASSRRPTRTGSSFAAVAQWVHTQGRRSELVDGLIAPLVGFAINISEYGLSPKPGSMDAPVSGER